MRIPITASTAPARITAITELYRIFLTNPVIPVIESSQTRIPGLR